MKEYVIDIDFTKFQVKVDAHNYIEALIKACGVVEKIKSFECVSYENTNKS